MSIIGQIGESYGGSERSAIHAITMHITLGRDKYVEILWDNIIDGYESQFYKNDPSEVLGYGPYDYGSVMHYPDWGFQTAWGLKTINGTVITCQFATIYVKHMNTNFPEM